MATYWIGVTGSRRRTDEEAVKARIQAEVEHAQRCYGEVGLLSGGARGPDTWAEAVARGMAVRLKVERPDLSGLGADARRYEFTERYYARNVRIAEQCQMLLAFVAQDRRGGTEHTIREAERLGRWVVVVKPPGKSAKTLGVLPGRVRALPYRGDGGGFACAEL